MRPPCAVSPLPPPSAGIGPSPIPPIPSPPLTHSVDATVTSSINPYLGRVTLGLRKHSWFSDLVDLSDPRFTFSASRGASLDLHQTSTVGSDPKRATAVRTAAGELARARCAVILSAGVWGTASMLMSSLGSTTLSGLWEHAVQPIVNPIQFDATFISRCYGRLRTGNLHSTGPYKAQAEFIICAADPAVAGSAPTLLSAWVLSQKASARGTIHLLDGDGTVAGNYTHLAGEPDAAAGAVDEIIAELKARYGSDLSVPDLSELNIVPSHHLGGGVSPVASAGRVHSLRPLAAWW